MAPLTVTTSTEVTGVGVHVDDSGVELEIGVVEAVVDGGGVDGGGVDVELGGGAEEVEIGCGVELVD